MDLLRLQGEPNETKLLPHNANRTTAKATTLRAKALRYASIPSSLPVKTS